jgi:hypothetical protein
MSVHEYSSLNAHVKIDQPDSYLNEMLSFNQLQLKVMLGNNEEEKIKVNIILHFTIENNSLFSF